MFVKLARKTAKNVTSTITAAQNISDLAIERMDPPVGSLVASDQTVNKDQSFTNLVELEVKKQLDAFVAATFQSEFLYRTVLILNFVISTFL